MFLKTLPLVLFLQFCSSIKVEDYFEQKCDKNVGFTTQEYKEWVSKLPFGTPFFYPMLSKLDLLRLTQNVLETPDLSGVDANTIDHGCITAYLDTSGTSATSLSLIKKGFCGKTVFKSLNSSENSPTTFISKPKFPGGPDGVVRISLTDNKSWQVLDICGGNGERAFGVMSTRPKLTPCEYEIITAHLKAIGFKEEFFYGINYTNCRNGCYITPQQLPYPVL